MNEFDKLKDRHPGLKIATDFHDVYQIETLMKQYPHTVDMIQIPAFLCRQTDLLTAAANTGKIVNVKKGQFVSYEQVCHIVDKLKNAPEVIITDRGFQFGYNSYVVDYVGLQYMLNESFPKYDVCLDVSHSMQIPNSGATTYGRHLSYGMGLMKAAKAIGVKTFFLETMPDPTIALSDRETTYHLSTVKKDMETCLLS